MERERREVYTEEGETQIQGDPRLQSDKNQRRKNKFVSGAQGRATQVCENWPPFVAFKGWMWPLDQMNLNFVDFNCSFEFCITAPFQGHILRYLIHVILLNLQEKLDFKERAI